MSLLEVLFNQLPQQLGTENEVKEISAPFRNRCTHTTTVLIGHRKVIREMPTKKVQ